MVYFKIPLLNPCQTFLLLTSAVGLSVGSGIKLEIIAKKITPAKNCKEEIDHQSLNKLTFIL